MMNTLAGPIPSRFMASTWPYSCTNRPTMAATAITQLPLIHQMNPPSSTVDSTDQTSG